MTRKVCLVTGATSGIGEATARALATLGAQVLVHGRSNEKCGRIVHEIKTDTGNNSVEPICADFASLADVRALATKVRTRVSRLDVLVNNAGGTVPKRTLTRDGLEYTFAVNHLAPYLLTRLLLETLTASAPARIVTVSSTMHRMATIDFDDLQSERRFGPMRAYGRSKLANILFTRSLASRLAGSGVTANALHPGGVRTGLSGSGPGFLSRLMGRFMLSPEQGARTSLYLATAADVAEVSGLYFVRCAPAKTSRDALDDDAAERLWQISAELTGLTA